MARRKPVGEARQPNFAPIQREYARVWKTPDDGNAHPFGSGRPFPDFASWCAARATLVDSMEAMGIRGADFDEK